MNEKQTPSLLRSETTQKVIDSDVFASFESAHEYDGQKPAETYKELDASADKKAAAKQAWANGKPADLSVSMGNIFDINTEKDPLFNRKQALKQWKQELIEAPEEEVPADVKQLYRWRVNEDIANINIIMSSRVGNMPAFRRWNEYIYGKPDEQIYKAALDWIANDAERLATSDKEILADSAKKVVEMLADKRGDRADIVPDADVFEAVRDKYSSQGGYYSQLFDGVTWPDAKKIANSDGDPIIEHVVKNNLHSDYEIGDASGTVWSVEHSTKSVRRPADYNLVVARFTGLVSHEVGMHLLEKENGSRSPIALDRTDRSEYNEGPAVLAEEAIYDSHSDFENTLRWRELLRRHIAISYACGVGEDSTKSSDEVYAFMNTIDKMYSAKASPSKTEEEINASAANKTATLLTRVLKGTNGVGGKFKNKNGIEVDMGGGAYLKDKIYLEGIVKTWKNLSELGPDFADIFVLFKTDFNNPRTLSKLLKLGVLPDNE